MIILSVDYGDARTGVAVCDRMEILASPVCVINEGYEPKVISAVAAEAQKQKAELIVVGLPKNMDGSEGSRAEKCTRFAEQLQEATGIETVMYDERLTTVWAHKTLSENNVRGKKRKAVVDAVSAVVILEGFMATRK
ncbi:MAG: Holliday junction resolvase RuvX [Clostridia bacterium]|nr:Holliday junction resolvase RuvX [Clostridia bacterium]